MLIFQNIRKKSTNLLVKGFLTSKNYNCIQNTQKLEQRQNIWGYVAIAFNKVDMDRLSKVGPDRLCAEWVIKNGGGIRMVEVPSKLMKDYNALPPENFKFHIKEVDASNSSVMKIGLYHFYGCKHIDTVILHNCKHLEEDGLEGLIHLKGSLKRLQVSGCYNLRANCLKVIAKLTQLQQLLLFNLMYIKNLDEVIQELKNALPQCQIRKNKPQ